MLDSRKNSESRQRCRPGRAVKIFSRYILSEVVQHAAIGVALFTFVIFMRDLGRLLEIVVRNSAPLPSVAELFLLTLPVACTITIPMGLLVGILIGLSRLAADSEVTAMRASGLGAWMFVRIIAIFAVAAWLLALANSIWLAPMSSAALSRLENKLRSSQASFEIQPRVFYEDFKNIVLYVEDVRAGSNASQWRGVFLADVTDPSAPKITHGAQRRHHRRGPQLAPHAPEPGSQQEMQPQNPDQYEISTFAQTDLPIALPPPDESKQDLVPVGEMSTGELWYPRPPSGSRYRQRRAIRRTPPPRGPDGTWSNFTAVSPCPPPAWCSPWSAFPLGLSSKKGGKSMGFVLTIALVFLYYFISLTGISLGRSGSIPPGPASGRPISCSSSRDSCCSTASSAT